MYPHAEAGVKESHLWRRAAKGGDIAVVLECRGVEGGGRGAWAASRGFNKGSCIFHARWSHLSETI